MKKVLFVGLISSLLFSCAKDSKVAHVERAFYYWKSNNELNNSSVLEQMSKCKIKKIYVKYFEVDYSETMGNYPYDKTDLSGYYMGKADSVRVVPTVFIKNGIFQYSKEKDLAVLADNIVFLIDKYNKGKFDKMAVTDEIQIDCDWTKSSKEKYFYLLKKIKEISKRNISCTLRLYPYKYPNIMGIPPVDKATLMCYNLIKPLSQKSRNSILDIAELASYLDKRRSYPIHLDIALPVFSWTQLYHNNQFAGLLDLNDEEMKVFTKRIKPMWYEVTKDTTLRYDRYFRIGDQIKYEDVTKATIENAIKLIKKNVALDDKTTITLFHLEENTFNKYSNEELSGFYDSFTK